MAFSALMFNREHCSWITSKIYHLATRCHPPKNLELKSYLVCVPLSSSNKSWKFSRIQIQLRTKVINKTMAQGYRNTFSLLRIRHMRPDQVSRLRPTTRLAAPFPPRYPADHAEILFEEFPKPSAAPRKHGLCPPLDQLCLRWGEPIDHCAHDQYKAETIRRFDTHLGDQLDIAKMEICS